jgi:hypothetical protein
MDLKLELPEEEEPIIAVVAPVGAPVLATVVVVFVAPAAAAEVVEFSCNP